MAKFEVTETRFATGTRIWRYEVEANSEEEALEMVMNGNVEHTSFTDDVEDDNYDPEYEVEEAR